MSAASDAALVASLVAVDPVGLGGVCLRSQVHPLRVEWLRLVRELLPAHLPLRRIPCNITDNRLLGGLDLASTLRLNRPILEPGVLAEADGGILVISMAERLSLHTAACMILHEERVGIVALDEGIGEDERTPASLRDRLAFLLDLDGISLRSPLPTLHDAQQITAARRQLGQVQISTHLLEMLCATALSIGAGSPRVSLLACRAARAAAALHGRSEAIEEDAILAGRLVLAPRATMVPAAPTQGSEDEVRPSDDRQDDDRQGDGEARPPEGEAQQAEGKTRDAAGERPQEQGEAAPGDSPQDPPQAAEQPAEVQSRVLTATQAAIPKGLLARIAAGMAGGRSPSGGDGRSGAFRNSGARGRPAGVRSGLPQGNAGLNVIETLRAAAPWQRLRGRAPGSRVSIRTQDFKVTRCKQRTRTLTIFAVDASGSSALHRLAEAKGAVELLLADCYIRRDQVAVIAFRGRAAELLLPPTRSLLRAKRSLAGLPGGGATPLAAAIDAAAALASQAQRRGETPTLVILTDGRANVARNGATGRESARSDALHAAKAVRLSKFKALLVDTSPRPSPLAEELATLMNAHYVPLPYFNSRALSDMVRAAAAV
jgi:magnesium chelatase subunit D